MSDRNDLTRPRLAGSTSRPLGHPIGSSYWGRPTGSHPGGSLHIERTSVPESPPVFQCSRFDREGPGRHPPKISMTFLLVTSPCGEARRFLENVVVAFQFKLSHTNPCPFAPPYFIRNRPEPSARQLPGHYFCETISVAHCAVLTRGFHHHPDDRLGAGGANQDSAIVA